MKICSFFFITLSLILSGYGCHNKNDFTDITKKEATDSIYNSILQPQINKVNFTEALRLLDSVYFKEKKHNIWSQVIYYYHHSWMSNMLQHHRLAIQYADTLVGLIDKYHIERYITTEYYGIYLERGNGYFDLNDYDNAYQNYFKARQVTVDYNVDSCRATHIISSIAIMLYRQQEYELAKDAYFDVLAYSRSCPDYNKNMEQQSFDDIALCYTKLNNYDSAEHYYRLALQNIEFYKYNPLNDTTTSLIRYASCKGVVLGNLAKVFAERNRLDSAEKLYRQAIYLNGGPGFEKGDAQLCQQQLAAVLLKEKKFGEMKIALDDLKKSLDTLPNSQALFGWKELMAAYYSNINNPQEELKYYRNFVAFRDSVTLAKKATTENNIIKELKDREQVFKITVLEKDNQLSKVYLWIAGILILMAGIIAFLIYKNFRKGKRNIRTLTTLNKKINEQQKQTEYALQQLEVSNKQKDNILAVVAHDLRNPISGIAAMSRSILEDSEELENKELITMIQKTSTDSLDLINELLQSNAQQNETLNRQQADINEIVSKSVALLQYKASGKDQHIKMSLLPGILMVNIDASKMERVLGNIIANAIKFSARHSEINVSVLKHHTEVMISVKDNGMGIEREMLSNIFDMPHTVKRNGTESEESFGLGLSICKKIVEAHNGKIWAESDGTNGSSFYITLPV